MLKVLNKIAGFILLLIGFLAIFFFGFIKWSENHARDMYEETITITCQSKYIDCADEYQFYKPIKVNPTQFSYLKKELVQLDLMGTESNLDSMFKYQDLYDAVFPEFTNNKIYQIKGKLRKYGGGTDNYNCDVECSIFYAQSIKDENGKLLYANGKIYK